MFSFYLLPVRKLRIKTNMIYTFYWPTAADSSNFWPCFCTAKSNSPQPVEEEEKEKVPPTEESTDASKAEETKMEH